jgi:hypothetical protein
MCCEARDTCALHFSFLEATQAPATNVHIHLTERGLSGGTHWTLTQTRDTSRSTRNNVTGLTSKLQVGEIRRQPFQGSLHHLYLQPYTAAICHITHSAFISWSVSVGQSVSQSFIAAHRSATQRSA